MPLLVTELELALASVLVTGFVGVATPLFAWLVARGNRRHERRLAHDARVFEHRATLYQDLLRSLSNEVLAFYARYRVIEGDRVTGEVTDAEWLSQVGAIASPEVREAVSGFTTWASRFHSAWAAFESFSGADSEEARLEFREAMGLEPGEEDAMVRRMFQEALDGCRDQVILIEDATRRELMDFRP
jgi:hypothetical protein